MKASNHPKIIIDVDRDFKQLLVDICQLKNMSMKKYVIDILKKQLNNDSDTLNEKLDILKSLRS